METITKLRMLYPLWTLVSIFALLYAPTLTEGSVLFRVGQVGQILVQLFQIAVALLLYKLFEKTNKEQALLLVLFAMLAVPLSLGAILQPEMIHLAEIFWSLWLIPLGTLIIKSKMFPQFLGYLLYIGAAGYMGGVISFFLTGTVTIYTEVLTFGELIWVLWITFIGPRKKSR